MSIAETSLGDETTQVSVPLDAQQSEILSPQAVRFLTSLSRKFEPTRRALLEERKERQRNLAEGALPDFLMGPDRSP